MDSKDILKKLSDAFDRTFTEKNFVEQIEIMLYEKNLKIGELESKLQEKRRALGIVTGDDVLINLMQKGVKI